MFAEGFHLEWVGATPPNLHCDTRRRRVVVQAGGFSLEKPRQTLQAMTSQRCRRLTPSDASDTVQEMTTISIRELRGRIVHWLSRVNEEREIIVTERGRLIARLLPALEPAKTNPFLPRRLLLGVAPLIDRPLRGPTSTEIVSNGRDER